MLGLELFSIEFIVLKVVETNIGYFVLTIFRYFNKIMIPINIYFILLRRVSLIRPAPVELPQVRKEARVSG